MESSPKDNRNANPVILEKVLFNFEWLQLILTMNENSSSDFIAQTTTSGEYRYSLQKQTHRTLIPLVHSPKAHSRQRVWGCSQELGAPCKSPPEGAGPAT